ncbi:MAG: hypothetical protein ABEN55_24325, partial [Bradymonadaceae bacterium]
DRGGGEVSRASAESPSADEASQGGAANTGDNRYQTTVEPGTITAGDSQRVKLAVVPASGLKVNREYPNWTLKVTPPDGVEMETTTFSSDDFTLDDAGARVSTTLSAADPGTYKLSGTAGFSVCNDETCHIMRDEQLAFRLHVSSNRDAPGGQPSAEQ